MVPNATAFFVSFHPLPPPNLTSSCSEELIDHKLRTCVRVPPPDEADPAGIVRFLSPKGEQVFETTPGEPVVLQIGTSDAGMSENVLRLLRHFNTYALLSCERVQKTIDVSITG